MLEIPGVVVDAYAGGEVVDVPAYRASGHEELAVAQFHSGRIGRFFRVDRARDHRVTPRDDVLDIGLRNGGKLMPRRPANKVQIGEADSAGQKEHSESDLPQTKAPGRPRGRSICCGAAGLARLAGGVGRRGITL